MDTTIETLLTSRLALWQDIQTQAHSEQAGNNVAGIEIAQLSMAGGITRPDRDTILLDWRQPGIEPGCLQNQTCPIEQSLLLAKLIHLYESDPVFPFVTNIEVQELGILA